MVERRYWQTRMILCKIWQNSEMRGALDEIASLLASFFAETDYVASDILAGLLLLVHSPEQPPPIILQLNTESNYPTWMKLPESLNMICRMLDFAVSVYGWPNYLINNRSCTSLCRLLQQIKCCCCRYNSNIQSNHTSFSRQRVRAVIDGDNCCSCNTVSFMLESNIKQSDIFYISFQNKLYQTPFVVLADHSTHSIVITIRGSASILDFVTDLSLNEDLFSVDVSKSGVWLEISKFVQLLLILSNTADFSLSFKMISFCCLG